MMDESYSRSQDTEGTTTTTTATTTTTTTVQSTPFCALAAHFELKWPDTPVRQCLPLLAAQSSLYCTEYRPRSQTKGRKQ
ncbi:mCG147858 [Mus musculus]|nr:mCG147858 [Mus musculus]